MLPLSKDYKRLVSEVKHRLIDRCGFREGLGRTPALTFFRLPEVRGSGLGVGSLQYLQKSLIFVVAETAGPWLNKRADNN